MFLYFFSFYFLEKLHFYKIGQDARQQEGCEGCFLKSKRLSNKTKSKQEIRITEDLLLKPETLYSYQTLHTQYAYGSVVGSVWPAGSSGKFGQVSLCDCCKGIGVNSIMCSACRLWVHKKYSGLSGRLSADPLYVFPIVKLADHTPTSSFLQILGIMEISNCLYLRQLRWYRHLQSSISCINKVTGLVIPGVCGQGRPIKTWSECVRKDLMAHNLPDVNPLDREIWCTRIRQSLPTLEPGTPTAP